MGEIIPRVLDLLGKNMLVSNKLFNFARVDFEKVFQLVCQGFLIRISQFFGQPLAIPPTGARSNPCKTPFKAGRIGQRRWQVPLMAMINLERLRQQ